MVAEERTALSTLERQSLRNPAHTNKHPNDSMIGVYVGMKCMESPISELVDKFMESPLRKIEREMNQYEMVS